MGLRLMGGSIEKAFWDSHNFLLGPRQLMVEGVL
jgi:hypothetical protein